MSNNFIQRFNIRGIIGVLVIVIGFYLLHDNTLRKTLKWL